MACDTLGGWAARSWPMGLCPLLPAVCACCGRLRWAESVVLIRSGKREFPAGIIPDENRNRKYGRENIPTEFVPVPARFPIFFPFSCFHYGNGTRSVSTGNGAGRDGIFPSRFQPYRLSCSPKQELEIRPPLLMDSGLFKLLFFKLVSLLVSIFVSLSSLFCS